jgi:hypothetical protein
MRNCLKLQTAISNPTLKKGSAMLKKVLKKFTLLFFLLVLLGSCGLRAREEKLQQKEAALNQREEALMLKENALQVKEAALLKKGYQLDSTQKMMAADSAFFNPDIVGTWTVTMHCTETNCAGSAVGDTKTEQWQVVKEGSAVKASVIENAKLVRVYSGTFNEKVLELKVQDGAPNPQQHTQMNVELQQKAPGRWEGRREIIRAEECRILYALEMVKQ